MKVLIRCIMIVFLFSADGTNGPAVVTVAAAPADIVRIEGHVPRDARGVRMERG